MKQKKPDRFERAVRKLADRGMPDYDEFVVADHEVIKLLRREHKAVVRMVEKELKQCRMYRQTSGDDATRNAWACRMAQCYEFLDQLTRRAT